METVMAERRVRVPVKSIVREGMFMFMLCDDNVLCGGVAMLYVAYLWRCCYNTNDFLWLRWLAGKEYVRVAGTFYLV